MTRRTSTPGDTSDNAGLPPADAFQADTSFTPDVSDHTNASTAAVKTTQPLSGSMEQQMAAMMARQDELEKQNQMLAQQASHLTRQLNAKAENMPEPLVHQTVDEAKASNPDAAVFTKDGWYVPTVTSANPVQRR